MKKHTIFRKLFPKFLFLSLLGFFALLSIGRSHFKNFHHQEKIDHLQNVAQIISPTISGFLLDKKYQVLQKHIEGITDKTKQRVTVMTPEGIVVADSNRDPNLLDNHKDRPEMQEALKGNIGRSIRFSQSLNEDSLYVALPIKMEEKKIVGVIRTSYISKSLKPVLDQYTLKIFIASLALGILLTLTLTYNTNKISNSLERIQRTVQELVEGKFNNLIENSSDDSLEIKNLINSLNMTARKLNQFFSKTRRQRNEREAILEGMSEGVLSIYMDNNIFHWNKAVCQFFDVPYSSDYKGLPLVEVFRNKQIHDMVKFIKSSKDVIEDEITLPNNTILQVHGNVLKKDDGTDLCVLMVFTDITKIRKLENHRKEFVANVSHELRTPLTSISGYVDTLLEENINDQDIQKKFLSTIKRNTDRLNRIIEDLLALSEFDLEKQKNEISFDSIDIRELLKRAISNSLENANKKNISISVDVRDIQIIRVNISLMEQAISNLIENAVKYSDTSSSVNVKSHLDIEKQWVTIEVQDNGPGISKDHQERLFERFYSVDKTRSRELGGSGLGLSIVKNIVLAHRGKVNLHSEVGKGSIFSVTLPINLDLSILTIS